MTPPSEQRDDRLAEREQALAVARAELRTERERLAAERAECDRLLAEACAASEEAARDRTRARRLAPRFVRWVKHRVVEARETLNDREAAIESERDRFAAERDRLLVLRSDFHTTAAETRDRLRDAWAAVEMHQARLNADWAEADRYFSEQTALLDARAAELTARESKLSKTNSHGGDAGSMQAEAAALEARIAHARDALTELESRRDRTRAELFGTGPPLELTALVAAAPAGLASCDADLVAIRATLERERAELDDRNRLLAEQFGTLAGARSKWQIAERATIAEMEALAASLRDREAELDAREEHLIRGDRRRRNDAYNLWQLRMRLEAWQSKLTTFEVRWHAERERRESDLERRTTFVIRREGELESAFTRWEKSRESERDRVRAELDYWAADRDRLANAAAEFELQRQLHDAELSTCAARALAAEEMVAAAVQDSGSDRARRRLAVLQKRWERLFDRKIQTIDSQRAQAAAEFAGLTERYRRLHALLTGVLEREAASNNASARDDLQRATTGSGLATLTPAADSAELTALRGEIERLATLLLEMEMPEPPAVELPWGFEEPEEPASVFQFEASARAA